MGLAEGLLDDRVLARLDQDPALGIRMSLLDLGVPPFWSSLLRFSELPLEVRPPSPWDAGRDRKQHTMSQRDYKTQKQIRVVNSHE